MKNKRKYKFSSGIQQIAMDTPDYSKAYELQAEEGAKNQGIQNTLGTFAGKYKGVADLANVAGSAIKSRSKGKGGAQLGGAVATGGAAGAAGWNVGNMIVPGLGGLIGAGVGMTAGAFVGANRAGKEYTKGKRFQAEADRQAEWDTYNKGFNTNGSATDAQARVAKNGKYKVKSKQPRMIESEGREPVFGPKMKNGKRKLLFYNPDLPTHEEGGVPMLVMPKAQKGKQKVKAKPVEEPYTPLEDNDSIIEEVAEIFDPTGISSWDDTYRSAHNFVNKKDRDITDYADLGLNIMGAIPVIGKVGKLGKLAKTAFKYIDKGADAGKIIKRAKQIQRASKAVAQVPKGNKFTQSVKRMARVGKFGADRVGDIQTGYNTGKDDLGTMIDKNYSPFKNPDWDRTHTFENATFLGRKIFPKVSGEKMYPYGAKQLKVNTLNNTALSSNLTGMPAANAANRFVQPMTGINQVARNIPEVRRKATIKNPMSQRKENPDTNRIINPPIPYELKPKPEKSRYEKGGKYVKVYAKGTSGTKLNLGNKKKINQVEYLTPKTFTGNLASEVENKKPILNRVTQESNNSNVDPREKTFIEPMVPRSNSIKEFEAAVNRPKFNVEPLTTKQTSLDLKLQPEKERKVSPVKIIEKIPLPVSKKETTKTKTKKKTVNKEQVIKDLANNFFTQNFARAEQERKADSTQYANNVLPTAIRLAGERKGKGRLNYVTENRNYHSNKGKKTGNNTCISGACLINKESGTNLPLNTKLLSDPNILKDNDINTRYNPAFKKNYKKLGFKSLAPTDKMQAGDFIQLGLFGNPFHTQVFLGNKEKTPLIAQDHGNDDETGIEFQNENYTPALNTAADAIEHKQANNVFRYMGLPKKAAMSKQQALELAKAKANAGMKKGSKKVKVYR